MYGHLPFMLFFKRNCLAAVNREELLDNYGIVDSMEAPVEAG